MSRLNFLKIVLITFILFPAALAVSLSAQATATFTQLHSFNSADGARPEGGLVQGTDGNFYGTTYWGGTYNDGTVFKITSGGTLATLHIFDETDGEEPYGSLILATDGNFYGATYVGGSHPSYGTVFKITSGGTLTVIHNFDYTDGYYPEGGLVQGTDGNFYGTTYHGGTAPLSGTAFKVTTGGILTTLHDFDSTAGYDPAAGLMQGSDGNFYGTTYFGGSHGYGTVFKINSAGALTTLYDFANRDGAYPEGALVQGNDGNFYGTTDAGGAHAAGTVFKITPGGVFTTLHVFANTDGAEPQAGLIQATDGNFYGTTFSGGAGAAHFGTVFETTPGGAFTTIYNFKDSATDGGYPKAGLVQGTDGSFYGTTDGGSALHGSVFRVSVGLGAFVEPEPASGKAGTTVIILGNGLTTASNVTFNGKAAAFTVVSTSEIKTSVPTGATTGKISVNTASGTLSSNVSFRLN